MKIFVVEAVSILADYPYRPEPVAYHKSLESAVKKAAELNKMYEKAQKEGYYDEVGNPIHFYQSKATVCEITVLD